MTQQNRPTALVDEIQTTEDTPSDRFIICVGLAVIAGIAVLIVEWSNLADWLLEISD